MQTSPMKTVKIEPYTHATFPEKQIIYGASETAHGFKNGIESCFKFLSFVSTVYGGTFSVSEKLLFSHLHQGSSAQLRVITLICNDLWHTSGR